MSTEEANNERPADWQAVCYEVRVPRPGPGSKVDFLGGCGWTGAVHNEGMWGEGAVEALSDAKVHQQKNPDHRAEVVRVG